MVILRGVNGISSSSIISRASPDMSLSKSSRSSSIEAKVMLDVLDDRGSRSDM